MSASTHDPRYDTILKTAIGVIEIFPEKARTDVLAELAELAGLERGYETRQLIEWAMQKLDDELGDS